MQTDEHGAGQLAIGTWEPSSSTLLSPPIAAVCSPPPRPPPHRLPAASVEPWAWLIFQPQHRLSATSYLEPALDLEPGNLGAKWAKTPRAPGRPHIHLLRG